MSLFIVFEGIDGAGTETQSNLLIKFLNKNEKEAELIKYPDYEGPIGQLIQDFLHKKFNFSPDVQFSLYATDMLKDRERILKALKDGKIVIADRYFTSTLAYQSITQGFPLDKGIKFAEIFDLPKPDLVIFLDISPDTSVRRKFKEKKTLDRHESDKDFLGRVRESYFNLIKNEVFAKKWIVINGEKTIEEVETEIHDIVLAESI